MPAATAGEPEKNLVQAGRQQLKDNKYQPLPVYSRAGTLGIIRLVETDVSKLEDAIVVLEDKEITDSRLKLEIVPKPKEDIVVSRERVKHFKAWLATDRAYKGAVAAIARGDLLAVSFELLSDFSIEL